MDVWKYVLKIKFQLLSLFCHKGLLVECNTVQMYNISPSVMCEGRQKPHHVDNRKYKKNKQIHRRKYKCSGANRNTNTISLPLLCEGHQKPHKGANKTPPPVEWKLHRHIGYLSNPSWPSHLWNKPRVSSRLKGGYKHRISSILKYLWVNYC